MTQRPGPNIAASVRQRLLNKAREMGHPFSELLQYFAMERFLYRLSKSSHADKFVLKGALMFSAWQAPFARPTMDIDLLGITDNSVDAIVAVTKEICLQEVEADGLMFDPDSVGGERIVEDADYGGVRVRFRGTLGTARITMQLDIGFGDVVVPKPEMADYPAILDLPTPRLRGYSRESAIAEKFEAMVKLGVLNSRVKDFFDIWLLSRQFDFDGGMMALAMKETFATRGTTVPGDPVSLTDGFAKEASRQTQWQGFVRKNRLQNVPASFADIVEAIAVFLGPITRVLAAGEGFQGSWKAPGPWRQSSGD
ncbi:MAG: nucleotidyl transferase AbiEii/AbiGii toxin family protein [Gammaproteobacteria bacterium]|nr:MAG: nucleotidyl transferase AbiEii/AbiGii toxin family protein [Gammaproteobacteria bacterium]